MIDFKKILVLGGCLLLAACSYSKPNAWEECVLTQKPYIFGHGGVDPSPVRAGATIIAISTDSTCVTMVPYTTKEHFDDIMTKNGIPVSFDLYGKFKVLDSVRLVRDFGGDGDADTGHGDEKAPFWYVSNLMGPIRNIARDAVRQHDLQSVAIDQTALLAIEAEIRDKTRAYITQMNLPVAMVDVSLGKANPPDGIKQQRTLTAEAEQRQQTELQIKIAEDNRKAAEESRAVADAAYQQRMGLNTEQFVALQAIQMQREVCPHSTCTFVSPGIATSVLVK